MRNVMACFAALIASGAAFASPIVGVRFGGTGPTTWSVGPAGFNPQGLTNLPDETGAPTPIDLSYSGAVGGNTIIGSFTPAAGQIPTHVPALTGLSASLQDNQGIAFTYSDLTPGATYNLYVIGAGAFGQTQTVTIAGAGGPLQFNQTLTNIGDVWVNGQVGSNAALETFAVSATASGAGTITVNVTAGNGLAVLAMGISPASTAVPEPATLAVFGGLVLAGAVGYRRRKATA